MYTRKENKMDKNEAIKIIRSNFPTGRKMLCEALEILIPELKESEDERIRKGIIEYLEQSQFGEEHYLIDDDIVRDYISWLEKQDLKKQEEELERAYKCADEVQYRNGLKAGQNEVLENPKKYGLEKQTFVHPAGNVELKFKEEAIKKIQEAANNGTEEGHYDGDKVLCDLLILLGYKEVVDEWNKLDKWYS